MRSTSFRAAPSFDCSRISGCTRQAAAKRLEALLADEPAELGNRKILVAGGLRISDLVRRAVEHDACDAFGTSERKRERYTRALRKSDKRRLRELKVVEQPAEVVEIGCAARLTPGKPESAPVVADDAK